MKTKEIQLVISGKVQGVSFRAAAQKKGQDLGLRGWVRNLSSGDVETFATGDEESIAEFVQWCHSGPKAAKVESVREVKAAGGLCSTFSILPNC